MHTSTYSNQNTIFFLNCTPKITLWARWYLVQVDLASTSESDITSKEQGKYYCIFLSKHPDDQGKSDEISRWWPECYTYTNIKESQEIVYNQRILIRTNACPDSKKYTQWAIELKLQLSQESNKGENCHLVRPFIFEPIYQLHQTRQKVHIDQWRSLQKQCNNLWILPPTFGSNVSRKPKLSNNSKIISNKRNSKN